MFKRIVSILIAVAICLSCVSCSETEDIIKKTDFLFDTVVSVTLYGTSDEALLDDCFSFLKGFEKVFSTTDDESELYKVNTSSQLELGLSAGLYDVLEIALRYAEMTDGAFDPTIEPVSSLYDFSGDFVPPVQESVTAGLEKVDYNHISLMTNNNGEKILKRDSSDIRIDLGAAAKGYIADRCRDYLAQQGIKSALIDLGGNIYCLGGKTEDGETKSFNVGVYDPLANDGSSFCTLKARDISIVTSGIYQRSAMYNNKLYHHILDSRTGMPVESELAGVTITGPDSLECDLLSTACFICGYEKAKECNFIHDDFGAAFVYKSGEIMYLGNFESLLTNA